jgi:hypothetical protein
MNLFICIPQILASTLLGPLSVVAFGGNVSAAIAFGGAFGFVGMAYPCIPAHSKPIPDPLVWECVVQPQAWFGPFPRPQSCWDQSAASESSAGTECWNNCKKQSCRLRAALYFTCTKRSCSLSSNRSQGPLQSQVTRESNLCRE